MQGKLVAVGLVIVLAWSGLANADASIDTLSLWDGEKQLRGFGEPNTAYVGQSFVALDTRITSLSFMLDGLDDVENNEPDNTTFNVLITPLAPSGDLPDFDNILYESGPYSTTLETGYETFTLDLDIPVQPGQSYMWVLDAFVAFDGEAGTAAIAATFNAYADGEFRFRNIADLPNDETRYDHDEEGWLIVQPPSTGEIPTVDAAFSMTFVPEPASFLLLSLASLAFCRRHT